MLQFCMIVDSQNGSIATINIYEELLDNDVVGVPKSLSSKFVCVLQDRMVIQGQDTRLYTGSDGMSLRPVRALTLLHSSLQ